MKYIKWQASILAVIGAQNHNKVRINNKTGKVEVTLLFSDTVQCVSLKEGLPAEITPRVRSNDWYH